ncbi:Zinc finger ccch domain-containing protein [Thalictrum thalictroides]|uniref:Zinc finger ccch domain-containing protein n=1 Tax=Thalictrum thalictroides TaxID=46969 RepID=A0A7J6V448_THATH|nr:Zinc finger ccch domain-containing protein [Thalictrum thalictroides]
MDNSEEVLSLKSPIEEKEIQVNKEVESPSSDSAEIAFIEALDKDFQNLVLEEKRNQNNLSSEKQLDDVVNENHNEKDLNLEEVSENRNDWSVDEEVNRDGWSLGQDDENRDGWTEVDLEQEKVNRQGWNVEESDETLQVKGKVKKFQYPLRPGEPDCTFYLRTGACGFGSNCKFNHPLKKQHIKVRSSSESEESIQAVEEKVGNPRRVGQLECKYYLTSGGCKFGKDCRYRHPREKSVVGPPAEFNFLGLPIRPGERECPFYMRTGSCKFATSCRFNHPDPSVGGLDSGYDTHSSVPLQSSSDSQVVTSWSSPQSVTDAIAYSDPSRSYMPVMLSPQGVHSGLEWNGYQAPVRPLYPSEGTVRPMAPTRNGLTKNMDGYGNHLQQKPLDEYPERPGQKECPYYMQTGDCKYKSTCRYHHPKTRGTKSTNLSPMGLPLRPDQIVCPHFSRYGICKYGAACKYDHTQNSNSSASPTTSGSTPLQYYHNSGTYGAANMADYGDGSNALLQQSM